MNVWLERDSRECDQGGDGEDSIEKSRITRGIVLVRPPSLAVIKRSTCYGGEVMLNIRTARNAPAK
jgi:hypothetical protein